MTAVSTAPLDVAPPAEVKEVTFTAAMEEQTTAILAKYPNRQAALLPLLWLCQDQWGWISKGLMSTIAEKLDLAPAFVEGVVSFYTMYQRQPPGKYLLQVCTTLSCQLCGTSDLVDHLRKKLEVDFGETTADGRFTLLDVQCLGACGEAPVIQINNDYYTNLSVASLDELLDGLK